MGRKKPIQKDRPLAGTVMCPLCRGLRTIWHSTPNLPRLFGFEEMWFMKPLRRGFDAYCTPGWPQTQNRYIEWSARPRKPIYDRQVGYFGDDVFDYQDLMSEQTWNLMEEDFERKKHPMASG